MKKGHPFRYLNLSAAESRILLLLEESPLSMKRLTQAMKEPRTTLYWPLTQLKKRGFIEGRKVGRERYWHSLFSQAVSHSTSELLTYLNKTKHGSGVHTIPLTQVSHILVYRGEKEIISLYEKLCKENRGGNIDIIYPLEARDVSEKVITVSFATRLNEAIKKNKISTRFIFNDQLLPVVQKYGKQFAESLMYRTASARILPSVSLNAASDIWIFKDHVVLVSMSERLAVEIKNQNMHDLLSQMFELLEGLGRPVDFTHVLKETIK